MANTPMRFKRFTAAFDDVARARLCQSSGSEHSGESDLVTDLSDLVDSFLETGGNYDVDHKEKENNEMEEGDRLDSMSLETQEMLKSLISEQADDVENTSHAKVMIRKEMEKACRSLGTSSDGFKRQAMSRLRQRGFDAGLCKSRWAKTGRQPPGEYEYIDVLISKTRYIVEVSMAAQFTIVRPTNSYESLLEIFPEVLVCRESEMKQLVRMMCHAMRVSMKKVGMHVSPWRRNGYMQSKWFGSYKRTTNVVSTLSSAKVCYGVDSVAGRSLVGFEALPAVVQLGNCIGDVVREVGLHGGNLKAVFNGMSCNL